MKKNFIVLLATPFVFFIFTASFLKIDASPGKATLNSNLTLCGNISNLIFPFYVQDASAWITIPDHPRFVNPYVKSGYPKIIANDNRVPAGKIEGTRLILNLEVMWADFHNETPDRTGLRVVAIAEKGKAPSIPAPLVRVKAGTIIDATIENTLKDSTITVFGLQTRPSEKMDSLYLNPGEKKQISFEAGEEGTYLYWIKLGRPVMGEEDQLGGAFIIDPASGAKTDRVLVINVFSTAIDQKIYAPGWVEALTINGKSWPFTEAMKYNVGDTTTWRVINATKRTHPMHLHGFYYHVLSKGGMLIDKTFIPSQRKFVVTEDLNGNQTMNMKWVASRPGKWLFHCHLSWHILPATRLPGTKELDPPNTHQHMAGLVLGMEVLPGKTDIIYKGELQEITLYAKDFDQSRKGFSLSEGSTPDLKNSPGPLVVLNQFQPTYVTVVNKTKDPTSVHWHGLEIESWADGVPEWSSSEGRTSPMIKPGESFRYKLALIRSGTFIYHSHMDDAIQMTQGLYGPLIVMPEGEIFNPAKDHIYIVGHKSPDPKSILDMELNGTFDQPDQNAVVGEHHRLRLIDINPVDQIWLYMMKDNKPIPVKFIAKDGADLPVEQQLMVEKSEPIGVGQTADFEFTPTSPGVYTLHVNSSWWPDGWEQKWIVKN